MTVGVIKETVCVNIAVFSSLIDAQQMLQDGALGEADSVAELPEGFGIGDRCIYGTWDHRDSTEENIPSD